MAWGTAQEPASLYSLLTVFPDSQLGEVGLCWTDPEDLPREWGFSRQNLPFLGASPDGILRHPLTPISPRPTCASPSSHPTAAHSLDQCTGSNRPAAQVESSEPSAIPEMSMQQHTENAMAAENRSPVGLLPASMPTVQDIERQLLQQSTATRRRVPLGSGTTVPAVTQVHVHTLGTYQDPPALPGMSPAFSQMSILPQQQQQQESGSQRAIAELLQLLQTGSQPASTQKPRVTNPRRAGRPQVAVLSGSAANVASATQGGAGRDVAAALGPNGMPSGPSQQATQSQLRQPRPIEWSALWPLDLPAFDRSSSQITADACNRLWHGTMRILSALQTAHISGNWPCLFAVHCPMCSFMSSALTFLSMIPCRAVPCRLYNRPQYVGILDMLFGITASISTRGNTHIDVPVCMTIHS